MGAQTHAKSSQGGNAIRSMTSLSALKCVAMESSRSLNSVKTMMMMTRTDARRHAKSLRDGHVAFRNLSHHVKRHVAMR